MKIKLLALVFLFVLCGCVTQRTVTVDRAVLLPEDRIFTVPAGQKIDVQLDGKMLFNMTFPATMKLVSPSVLVRQEENLNNAMFNKIKADKTTSRNTGIFAGIITVLGGLFTWINSMKKKEEVKK